AGLDDTAQQLALLRPWRVEEHHAKRLAAALDRDLLPAVVREAARGDAARVYVALALGEEEEELQSRIRHELAQDALPALRRGPAVAQLLEKGGHPVHCVVARAVEPSIDRVLNPCTQRPEDDRDDKCRAGGRQGGAAAE